MVINMNTITEKKAIIEIAECLCEKYNTKMNFVNVNQRNALLFTNEQFGLAFTMCTANKSRCIKIEDLLIEEQYRNKKLGTNIMDDLIKISKKYDLPIGLWCEKDNKKAQKFYKNLGFKHLDTMNDYWYEYNTKE